MTQENAIRRAHFHVRDEAEVVSALNDSLDLAGSALTVFFCSPDYDASKLAASLNQVTDKTNVVGCTSAGEIGSEGYSNSGISAFSLNSRDFKVATQTFGQLRNFSVDQAQQIVERGLAELREQGVDTTDNKTFGLLLVDGLSCAEEPLTYKLQNALREIPLVGGSAGDGLNFGITRTFSDREFASDSAVLALVHTQKPWDIIREQHIEPTDCKFVVTEADPDNRIIFELNSEPAAIELARAIGVDSPEELTPGILAAHPLMVKMGGSWFLRSAHSVIENNAIKLFCAIEEGQVLSLGRAEDLVASLSDCLIDVEKRLGKVELMIACDCILRRLELENKNRLVDASNVLKQFNTVGFSTYGEQFGTVHANQTLTGIAIG